MSGFARVAGGVPVGTILPIMTPVPPKGFVLTNGFLMPQAGLYAKLFAQLGHACRLNTETDAALNAAGKFRLPNDDMARAMLAADYSYDFVQTPTINWAGGLSISTDLPLTNGACFAKRLTQRLVVADGLDYRELQLPTLPSGRYFVPFRFTADPQVYSAMVGIYMCEYRMQTAAGHFFNFRFFIEKTAGGQLHEYGHIFGRLIPGVGSLTVAVPALEKTEASHTKREWCFYFDDAAMTAGIYCDGVNYPSTLSMPSGTAGSWKPGFKISTPAGTTNYGGGCNLEIIDGEWFEKTSIAPAIPAGGYIAAMPTTRRANIGKTGGSTTHAHTVGGTALTKAHLPANLSIQVEEAGSSTSWMGQTQGGSNLTNGGGQTHAHTLTTESSLPPYMTALFAIKY